jgi:membrane protease YdiL (CAAX protease family)
MAKPGTYFPATRHPWPCLLFVLPILLAYEAGVLLLGGPHPETVRNGADHWLRTQLISLGVPYSWVPPLVLALGFAGWCWARRAERPGDMVGVLSGMVIESVTFALGLWGVSRALAPLLQGLGVELAVDTAREDALRLVITYLGAGIYEEALFRLLLFSALSRLMRLIEVPGLIALLLAAVASATLFSSAHHWGPHGQAYSNYLFLFRLVAGLYFALLYHARGFGIAVGAHACYNVMVSVGAS